jgi:hypothetical protein
MIPFKIYTRKKIFNFYTGMSFFIFIWIWRMTKDEARLVRHEKIHFLQQLEMLFIFHWILYVFFYVVSRSKGHGHYSAYRHNPFEIEAYNNEHDTDYLKSRKRFAWMGCMKSYYRELSGTNKKSVDKKVMEY